MNELRLVANAVKHAEGSATKQLRELRPELFKNPVFDGFDEDPICSQGFEFPVHLPLAGEDLFVRQQLLKLYCDAAESFFSEIAEDFQARHHEYLPR